MPHRIDPAILREYDVRGVIDVDLGPADAHAIGRGFATHVRRAGGMRVVVGHDGRLSSPVLEAALIEGLRASGVDVVRIGLGPTPMLYFAEVALEADGGIQITGSHNPADQNGFKFVLRHRPFFGGDIRSLGTMAQVGDWAEGKGTLSDADVIDPYVDRLMQGHADGAFRIGWDAGNGASGEVIEKLVARLPGEHYTLFTAIDGTFPNHHPDPTVETNLADLKRLVTEQGLDFGLAFDGDGDRLGAVDGQGQVVPADQLLAILAGPVLRVRPGATILADVKASQAVFDRIAELGGTPLMGQSGHSLMKTKMRETGAALGGELSGHFYFGQDYYGFDDAHYAAIRLMQAVQAGGGSLAALRDAMPAMANTPELRFPVEPARRFAVMDEVRARLAAAGASVDATDGMRVTTPDGWWLLRASNTQDMLTARAEARDRAGLDRVLAMLNDQLVRSGVAAVDCTRP